MAEQVAQPPPPTGLGAVHGGANPGRAEPQEGLGRLGVVARNERDGGNRRELAHEARDRGQLVALAAVHRDDEGVDAAAARHMHRVAERAGVQGRETAVTSGVDTWAIGGRENGADGHHARETIAWRNQPRVKVRRPRLRNRRTGARSPQLPVKPARRWWSGCAARSRRWKECATGARRRSATAPPVTMSPASSGRSASPSSSRPSPSTAAPTTTWSGRYRAATRAVPRYSWGRTSIPHRTPPARTTTPAASPR